MKVDCQLRNLTESSEIGENFTDSWDSNSTPILTLIVLDFNIKNHPHPDHPDHPHSGRLQR